MWSTVGRVSLDGSRDSTVDCKLQWEGEVYNCAACVRNMLGVGHHWVTMRPGVEWEGVEEWCHEGACHQFNVDLGSDVITKIPG